MKFFKTAGQHGTETDLLKAACEKIQKGSIHVTVIGNFRMKMLRIAVTVHHLKHGSAILAPGPPLAREGFLSAGPPTEP